MTLALVNNTYKATSVFILWEFLTFQMWSVNKKHSNIQINLIMESIVSVLAETIAGFTGNAYACFNTRMSTATDTCKEIFRGDKNDFDAF